MPSSPPRTTPPAVVRVRVVLALLTVATAVTVTVELLPSAVLPAMADDLGVSTGAVGVLVSAWAVTVAVTTYPLVRLTTRWSRRRLLTGALAAVAAANLATALSPGLETASVGRVLAASAHGLFWALVVAHVAAIVDPDRLGRALALVMSGPTLAGLGGLPLVAFLAEPLGWRVVVATLSAVLALTAGVLWWATTDSAASTTFEDGPIRWDRSAAAVMGVAVSGGLVLVGHFAAFTYVAGIVTTLGGLGREAISLQLLVLGGAGALGVAFSGVAADRFPRSAVVATAFLLALALLTLRLGAGEPARFTGAVALWGLTIGAFPPLLQARVLRVSSPGFRPLAGSVVVTVLNLGVATGATLGGLAQGRGHDLVVAVGSVAAGTGALLLAATSARRPAA